jgi:hypothetical protein
MKLGEAILMVANDLHTLWQRNRQSHQAASALQLCHCPEGITIKLECSYTGSGLGLFEYMPSTYESCIRHVTYVTDCCDGYEAISEGSRP